MVYGLAAFGVSLHYSYCCGKLKEVSVKLDNPPVDHKCPMKGDKDCCKEKTVDLKLNQQQQVSQQVVFEPQLFAIDLNPIVFNWNENIITAPQSKFIPNRPPPLSCLSLTILHENFRI